MLIIRLCSRVGVAVKGLRAGLPVSGLLMIVPVLPCWCLRVARTMWPGGGQAQGMQAPSGGLRRPDPQWDNGSWVSPLAGVLAEFLLHDGNRTGLLLRQGVHGSV